MIVSSGTLGGLVAMDLMLYAHCLDGGCRHVAALDMGALIARYGEGATVKGPRRIGSGLLRCGRCGNRNCSMQIGLVNSPQMSR
jgi:hypothetical protein